LEELVSSDISGLITFSLNRLEAGERRMGPKNDEPVATLLNVDSGLLRDAVSIVSLALGLKDIPAFINLDEDKNDGSCEPVKEWYSDPKTGESSEIVCIRSQMFCA
jgi:hypothetical protein